MKNIKAIIAIITAVATAATATIVFVACSKKAPEEETTTLQTTVSTTKSLVDEEEADTAEATLEKATASTQKNETTTKKQSTTKKQTTTKPAQKKPQATQPQTTRAPETTTKRETTTIPLKTTARDVQKWGNDFIKSEHHIKVNSSLTPQNSTVGLGIAIYDYQLESGDTQLNVMHGIGYSIAMAQEEHGLNCIEDMYVCYDEAEQYFHILYRLKSNVNASYDVGFVH